MERKYKVSKYKGLDDLCSEVIRKEAVKSGGCQKCHTAYSDYTQLQCCHYHGRRKISVRFDPDNLLGLCAGCHRWLDSQPAEFSEWMLERLGKQRYDDLFIRSKITPARVDINLLTLYYQEKLRLL